MNSENINLLSQRVDGVLATVRNLRQEVANLKQNLAAKEAEMQDRNLVLESLNAEINDCKAALTARANQAAAQDEAINQKQGTTDELQGTLANANARQTKAWKPLRAKLHRSTTPSENAMNSPASCRNN